MAAATDCRTGLWLLFLLTILLPQSTYASFFQPAEEETLAPSFAPTIGKKRLDDTFTILFFSDLETNYRGHDIDRSRYILHYLDTLNERNLTFHQLSQS